MSKISDIICGIGRNSRAIVFDGMATVFDCLSNSLRVSLSALSNECQHNAVL